MSITANDARIGNFTSSNIYNLMRSGRGDEMFGVPAWTYIEEKKMERKLGLSLETESNDRNLTWGQLLEKYVFELLGLEYQLVSQETIVHKEIPTWAGSPDANKFVSPKVVCDMKAPRTRKSFCQLVDPLYEGKNGDEAIEIIRETHSSGEQYYWQLVSNAVLTDSEIAELIVFMPYLSELQAIRDFATNYDSPIQYRYAWIANAQDEELPYLKDDGVYKNLNIIRFNVPEHAKAELRSRVIVASKYLN